MGDSSGREPEYPCQGLEQNREDNDVGERHCAASDLRLISRFVTSHYPQRLYGLERKSKYRPRLLGQLGNVDALLMVCYSTIVVSTLPIGVGARLPLPLTLR